MKIMAKQATKRVSTIKLPNGQYTGTGRETLSELFRVHFPNSGLIDNLDNGQGQRNLGARQSRTNRADWNLARVIINQTKIRWALNTFKQFKTAGTDEIVPALLQHGADLLVPRLCRIYRACMEYGFIPMLWSKLR
jgi:hypothetical protein